MKRTQTGVRALWLVLPVIAWLLCPLPAICAEEGGAVEHLHMAEALDPADVASARLRALSMGHLAEAAKAAETPAAPAPAATE